MQLSLFSNQMYSEKILYKSVLERNRSGLSKLIMADSKCHNNTTKAKMNVCSANRALIIVIPIDPKYQRDNERYRNKNTDTRQNGSRDAWPLF
ncbi:MAG: hypothetical protein CL912_18380 [Deltaproteobacteria bacterium]|nr:hypothetical protein [Deltaproteobacteria bacterium]